MPDSKNKKDHRSVLGMWTSASGELIGMMALEYIDKAIRFGMLVYLTSSQ
jgi:hypothetical protein